METGTDSGTRAGLAIDTNKKLCCSFGRSRQPGLTATRNRAHFGLVVQRHRLVDASPFKAGRAVELGGAAVSVREEISDSRRREHVGQSRA